METSDSLDALKWRAPIKRIAASALMMAAFDWGVV
jgi:hypothetical protein